MKANKIFIIVAASIVAGVSLCSCKKAVVTEVKSLKSEMDSVSYALGVNIGHDLAKNLETLPGDSKINQDVFLAGLAAELKANETLIAADSAITILQKFFTAVQEKAMEEEKAKNTQEGKEYMETNGKREGVVTTESGLQYEVITEGKGPKPTAEDIVKCHYHGTLIDGTVFDSSVERGEPAEFPLNAVIKGWTEGVQLMSVGSKYRFVIPGDLAYGEYGMGGRGPIGPNQTLIFEVELLDIVKK